MVIREDYVAIRKASSAIVEVLSAIRKVSSAIVEVLSAIGEVSPAIHEVLSAIPSHSGVTSLAVFFRTRYNVIGN